MVPAELSALMTQLPMPLPRPENSEVSPLRLELPRPESPSPDAPLPEWLLPMIFIGVQAEMLRDGLPPAIAVFTEDRTAETQELMPLGRLALAKAVFTQAETSLASCDALVEVAVEVLGMAFMMQLLRLEPSPDRADDRPVMLGTFTLVEELTEVVGVWTWVVVVLAPPPPAAAAMPRPAALNSAMILPMRPDRNPPKNIPWVLSIAGGRHTLCRK